MAAPQAPVEPQIAVKTCERLIEASAAKCAAAPAPVQAGSEVADSLAGLSASIAFGSLVLAVVAFIAALGWGFFFVGLARHEARIHAKKTVDDQIRGLCEEWLSKNVPRMFREYANLATPSSNESDSGSFNANQVAENVDDENPESRA